MRAVQMSTEQMCHHLKTDDTTHLALYVCVHIFLLHHTLYVCVCTDFCCICVLLVHHCDIASYITPTNAAPQTSYQYICGDLNVLIYRLQRIRGDKIFCMHIKYVHTHAVCRVCVHIVCAHRHCKEKCD